MQLHCELEQAILHERAASGLQEGYPGEEMPSPSCSEELGFPGPEPCRQESVKEEMCVSTEQENQLRKEMCIGKYLFACKIM